jgi:hypothetical protein
VKSTTALVKLFKENGFTLIRDKNHQIWGCPCGHTQLVSSGSPCGGRADRNAASQIRRTLKVCATERTTTP